MEVAGGGGGVRAVQLHRVWRSERSAEEPIVFGHREQDASLGLHEVGEHLKRGGGGGGGGGLGGEALFASL